MNYNALSRRTVIKSSAFGLLSVCIPTAVLSRQASAFINKYNASMPHDRYPAIALDVASEVVGVSHFNLDRLKVLVDARPELAKAVWDFGFGDWESAIAAGSHVGRKDIVEYLVSKGATPTIFTYAMLGSYDMVKSIIDFSPGIQRSLGPHGISLLRHAKIGLESGTSDKAKASRLIEYLEAFGDADGKTYLTIEDAEKEQYLGDYKYGEGKEDGFSIKLNGRKMLSLGRLGKNGGSLYKTGAHQFTYNGSPSVNITFEVQNGRAVALTLNEPGLSLTALKI